jgi:WD40 repeat protein
MSKEIMKAPYLSLFLFYNFDYKMSTKPLKHLLLFLLASRTVSQWTANGTI